MDIFKDKDLGESCDGDCANCDLDKIHNTTVYTLTTAVSVTTLEKMKILMKHVTDYIDGNEDYGEVEMTLTGSRALRMPVKKSSRTSIGIVAVRSPEELMDFLKGIFGGEELPKDLQELLKDSEGPEAEKLLKEYLERHK